MNQRSGIDPPSAATWLTAAQACARLDVKPQTLYAYVSRGRIRSRAVVGSRRREYLADDVDRVAVRSDARAGHAAVASGALRWGEPVLDSAITEIRDGDFAYRGVSAVQLAARGVGFEAVCARLWDLAPSHPDEAWPELVARRAAMPRTVVAEDARPFDAMLAALTWLAPRDPQREAPGPASVIACARRIVVGLVDAVARSHPDATTCDDAAPTTIAAALAVALGRRPSARTIAEIDRALVLVADHELNASTFAARVAASAGADLYACTIAALATLTGPRHGGMTARVQALLAETGRPERAVAVLRDRLARGDGLPGFGHPLYPSGDPRTPPLLDAARRIAPARAAVPLALVDAVALVGGQPPTSDFGLVTLATALDLPPAGAAAMFAVGRCAGWIAHALEQRAADFLLRPRARYVGPAETPAVFDSKA